jgi:hypothetical protein
VAGYRVGLGDPLDSSDLLCQLGNAGWLSVYQDKGSDHSANVALIGVGVRSTEGVKVQFRFERSLG